MRGTLVRLLVLRSGVTPYYFLNRGIVKSYGDRDDPQVNPLHVPRLA